jgi:hypothetical protein
MKKQKAKKRPSKFNWRLAGLIFGVLLIIGILAAQFTYNKIVWQSVNRQANSELRDMIIDALQGLSQQAVIDGPSRKVYVPEARMVLPPYPHDVQGLRYSYTPQNDKGNLDAELLVTTNDTLANGISAIRSGNKVEDIFAGVPKAQACSRQIIVAFKDSYGQPGEDNAKVGVVNLADGRNAYLYLDAGCKDNSEPLIKYLQQLQSY